MDYVITFSDVMAGLMSIGLGVITFFVKKWFDKMEKKDDVLQSAIENKLEEKTGNDIQNIRHEINDIKGDFATTFVLREDFFRSMNGVEDRMKIIDNKLDKLLLMGKENK